jgi:hypothetical protein
MKRHDLSQEHLFGMHLPTYRAAYAVLSLLTVDPTRCTEAYWLRLRRKCLTRSQKDKISITQCDEEMTDFSKFSEGQYTVHQLLDFPPYIILHNSKGRRIKTEGRMRPSKNPVRRVFPA